MTRGLTGQRAGRMQKIAFDATPIDAERPDLEARIGWLLAMSRLHHADLSMRDGRAFTQAMSDADVPVSRSLISRWESGEIPVSYDALLAYETILGFPSGELTSVVGYLRSAVPGVREKLIRPRLDPQSPTFADRLDELIQVAEDGKAAPADWQDLGWHLAQLPLVHLRAHTWEHLTQTLVGMVPRGIGVAFRQLSTATMNLARVPRAREHLLVAISDYLHTPFVQVVNNPIGALDLFDCRPSATLLLEMLEEPLDADAFRVAVWTATQKLRLRQFTPEETGRLEAFVLTQWRGDAPRAADQLAELIAVLPTGLGDRLTGEATRLGRNRLGYVLEHGETIAASSAEEFAQGMAGRALSEVRQRSTRELPYAGDRMLPRLIREALFHRTSESRYHAGWLLAASPFREAINDELFALLADPAHPTPFRHSAARLAQLLATEQHRDRLQALITDPDENVAISGARGLGHLVRAASSDEALRSALSAPGSERRTARSAALVYALGMSGSPTLNQLAERAPHRWQREAAGWWLSAGSGVRA